MNALQPFFFNGREVRVVRDELGDPWFVAKDVCDVLGIENSRDAVSRLDDDEKADVGITDTSSQKVEQRRSVNIVSESGLYALIFTSRKPEAKAFRKWVTGTVLPSLRRTGRYEMPSPAAPHPAESPLLLLEGELVRLRASAAFFQDMTEVLNTLAYARGADGVSSGMAGALRTVAGSSGELLGRIAGIVAQVRGRTLDAVKEAMAAGRINPAEAAVRSARAAKAARARWDKERDQNAAVPKSKKGSGSTH